MDLSINKVKQHKQNVNFGGVRSTYDINNVPVFSFTLPAHKKNEKVFVELVPINKNDRGGYNNPDLSESFTAEFEENKPLSIAEDFIKTSFDGFAYRYKITDGENTRYVLDQAEKININNSKEKMNIVKVSQNYGIMPKAGTMRHSFLDSDGILADNNVSLDKAKLETIDKDFVRNHANKLGGSVRGLDYLLTQTTELDPYGYIISTPDIGVDPTSSHKYWPNNLYQCSNIEDFKNLNYHLFERGKGYVADGAFTSQSLQSPLVQHALKWGEASPWYGMLKIEDNTTLGVLPNNSETMKHVGVRIVNNPQNKNYDNTKPSYIQFYDDRLLSKELQNDSSKIVYSYDKSPDDHYEITANDDTIYPFYFEISAYDKNQLKEFKNKNAVLLKDMEDYKNFLTFKNYKIDARHDSAGASFWDGNRDIIKLNLSNSKDLTAMNNARKYVCNAAVFWTELIQSDLILRTAQLSNKEKEKLAKENNLDDRYDLIKAQINESEHPVLKENKTIEKYIESFPIQSLETSPELSAVFAQPQFNQELFEGEIFNTVNNLVNKTFENAIDEDLLKDEEYMAYIAKTCANNVIKAILLKAMNPDAINENGSINLEEAKKITLKSLETCDPSSPEKERQEVIKAIYKGLKKVNVDDIASKVKEQTENITLEDFKLAESIVIQSKAGLNWRFDAAKDIGDLDAVRAGEKDFSEVWDGKYGVEGFWSDFVYNVRKYNPSALVVNEITDFWSFYDHNNQEIQKNFDKFFANPDKKERDFLNATGSTTSSNYAKYFNKLSAYVGTNPENRDSGGDNDPKSRAGNVDKLRSCVKDFLENNQPNNGILSHSFVENHDKPRVLHTLPLDLDLFFNQKSEEEFRKDVAYLTKSTDYSLMEPKAIAVGKAFKNQIENSNFTEGEKEKLKKALEELVLGKKDKNSELNPKRALAFAVLPYEITIRDMFKKAGMTDNLDEDVLDFHYNMLNNSMVLQQNLWQMMNAIAGTPTLFNGAEFAQTGYETPSKNVYVGNRNPVLHDIVQDERYRKYNEKMQAISGMYKLPKLSAIRSGYPAVLQAYTNNIEDYKLLEGMDSGNFDYQMGNIAKNGGMEQVKAFFELEEDEQNKDRMQEMLGIYNNDENFNNFNNYYSAKTDDNRNLIEYGLEVFERNNQAYKTELGILPIYKKDDKGSEVVQVITNYGVPRSELSQNYEAKDEPRKMTSIKIVDSDENCPFEEGTILKRKKYIGGNTYSDEKSPLSDAVERKYKVTNGEIVPADDGVIDIDDTVLTFYKAN